MVFLGQWLTCRPIFMLFMLYGLIIKVDKALSLRKAAVTDQQTEQSTNYIPSLYSTADLQDFA